MQEMHASSDRGVLQSCYFSSSQNIRDEPLHSAYVVKGP